MMIKSSSLPRDNRLKWHFIKFCLMVDHLFPPSNVINLFPLTMKNSMLKHRIFTTGKFEIDNPKIFYLYWTKNIFVPSESSYSKNIDANGKSKTDRSVQWALNRNYVLWLKFAGPISSISHIFASSLLSAHIGLHIRAPAAAPMWRA